MSDRLLKKGTGWRVGWNPNTCSYPALIGAEDWAIELTEAEFSEFCRLLAKLIETMAAIASELMDEERVACEAESDLLWLEAEGYPHAYSVRLILQQGRRCEGNWTEEAVSGLIQALPTLEKDFLAGGNSEPLIF